MACPRGSVHNCASSSRGLEAIWRWTATDSIPTIRGLIPEQALMMGGLRFLQAARARGLESQFLRIWRLSGSVLSPGFQNMLVGIKPTIGLVSRAGIVPITEDQDTAGPLARTVTDAAKVLGVIAGFDPQDPATAACLTPGNCLSDYTRFLHKHALRGARIAVPYYSYWTTGSGRESMSAERANVMENGVAVLGA